MLTGFGSVAFGEKIHECPPESGYIPLHDEKGGLLDCVSPADCVAQKARYVKDGVCRRLIDPKTGQPITEAQIAALSKIQFAAPAVGKPKMAATAFRPTAASVKAISSALARPGTFSPSTSVAAPSGAPAAPAAALPPAADSSYVLKTATEPAQPAPAKESPAKSDEPKVNRKLLLIGAGVAAAAAAFFLLRPKTAKANRRRRGGSR
jgi:hypothetical protein